MTYQNEVTYTVYDERSRSHVQHMVTFTRPYRLTIKGAGRMLSDNCLSGGEIKVKSINAYKLYSTKESD